MLETVTRIIAATALAGSLGACQGSEDPLMLAAREGDSAKIQAAIDAGADVNTNFADRKTNSEGGWWYRASTPLGTAACHGHDQAVELLVEHGAKLDAKLDVKLNRPTEEGMLSTTEHQWTALLCAAWYGEFRGVEALVDAGADVDARSPDGQTALFKALSLDYGIIRVLTEAGADTELTDNYGRTALHWAAYTHGADKAVGVLIDAGAKLDATDNEGRTPLDLASTEDSRQLLRAAGAKRSREL